MLAVLFLPSQLVFAAQSEWAHIGADGRLNYRPLPAGDRILDFSHAGYLGGGQRIPDVPVQKTITPSGSDDSMAIQTAINDISRRALRDGFRGAVLLAPGIFNCSNALVIQASGVVLRGSGSGTNGTTIRMTGEPHLCFEIGLATTVKPIDRPVTITDAYVPAGVDSLHVANAAGFHVGDRVLINRPVTPAWIKFMGMDALTRGNKNEHWLSGELHTERTLLNISSNRITLDVPLADSMDSTYLNPPGGSVVKADFTGRLTQIGLENFRLISPPQPVTIYQPHNQALKMDGVSDSWVRDLAVENTVNSFYFGEHTSRLTMEGVTITHAVASRGAAKPADIWAGGTQTLVDRCAATGDNLFYFSTGARMQGPVVVLNCVFHGDGHVSPHMRWATGLLIDCCQVPEGGIDLMNRGEMGTGHGWTIGWSVAWNCRAKTFLIQQPPGSANWAIGCTGKQETAPMPFRKEPKLPQGYIESEGQAVVPASLFLAQLRERLGAPALATIGY